MSALLFSAPPPNEERYEVHIQLCKEKFDFVFPMFYSTIKRIFNINAQKYDYELFESSFSRMIRLHDLGKLTRKWQDRINPYKPPLPSHSTLGAAYLWKTLPYGIKEPVSFAVAIHHTDRGLLGDNIEKPDVQAILDVIVDNNGNINWHDEVEKVGGDYFPEDAKKFKLSDLKDMARGLRIWSKGCALLEQHQRRIQASLAHHILKLCDVSAGTERNEYKKKDEQDYYGGWLMVENIHNYVENIKQRGI